MEEMETALQRKAVADTYNSMQGLNGGIQVGPTLSNYVNPQNPQVLESQTDVILSTLINFLGKILENNTGGPPSFVTPQPLPPVTPNSTVSEDFLPPWEIE